MTRLREADIAAALAHAGDGRLRGDHDFNPHMDPNVEDLRPAAVLVPLIERAGGWSVVLTRRADSLRQHAGQVAFPGGRLDPGDASLEAAALREAWEEIGLPPTQVRLLGRLDDYVTITRYRVTPVVGVIHGDFTPRLDPREVASLFEAPLDFLVDAANHQRHMREWQGRERHYYVIPTEPDRVWGATAGMLVRLAERLRPALHDAMA